MKIPYANLTPEQALEQHDLLTGEYNSFKEMGLALDMSRGKPCPSQLDLSGDLYKTLDEGFKSADGVDTRNYGEPAGLAEMKQIFAELLDLETEDILVGENSSLNLMFDVISRAMSHGLPNSPCPWNRCEKVKFLCPSPGYDRHFAVTEYFGVEMISVPMTGSGPDMDMVEALVKDDPLVKGMWCVPYYSNPTGEIYSDETICRLAGMACAAPDFLIMWDHAYAVHHLYGEAPKQANILRACRRAGNGNRVILFASTSKITFSGAGVTCLAADHENMKSQLNVLGLQTIGYNKINQLAHARFLGNLDGVKVLMERHAEILRPKFRLVDEVLSENLDGLGVASWTRPMGGYFISLTVPKHTAARVVQLCAEANVKLTPAGATYPYGRDPEDSNIRIAPTFPSEEELRHATQLLTVCVRIAALERQLTLNAG